MGEKKNFQVVLERTVHQHSRPIVIKAEDERAASRIAVCDDTVEFKQTNVETEVRSILEIEDQNTADNPKEVEFAQRLARYRCTLLKACTRINNLRVGFKMKRVGITARRFK